MQNIALILLGAGESNRFKNYINQTRIPKKQWLRLGEIPLWLEVAKRLSSAYPFIDLVLSVDKTEISYVQKYLLSFNLNFKCASGGNTRQESLQNAIDLLKDSVEFVFVSDIARCNVSKEFCARILNSAKEALESKKDSNCHPHCFVPYLNVFDTIAYLDNSLQYLKRECLKIIQTPQLSNLETLKKAFKLGDFTDESSAIFQFGGNIEYLIGYENAKKLTLLEDLKDLNLPPPSSKILIGTGSDIHALDKGSGIVLGGVRIPCEFKLIAHSDGDVCLHALSDAILGAIGAGDIGEWFPDNDPVYKGADSANLLAKIVQFSIDVGYSISQADITIFAQRPKLAPYKLQMEQKIAEILGIPTFKVNVKATTTEKLGFVGKEEGILVQASVAMEYFNWTNLLKQEGK
ncbi:MAG: bifunctional 2-C-methyl-D-erythritol 4-phosphate cytidylyltransferase/2-C-methyl-D-erythritol 2,4-cyclodiphosphate synthase [Helicobacteraceae bacterium]|nr:bifunctional 2-C-methyl-D-erythritol 4-phosphate cytidylyltransferase/2-C-methyl-D-erythritol 2,4-cyclodiphosphate synthase [Helicobacteraceae bacterium]